MDMEAFLNKAQELTSTGFLTIMFYIFISSIVIGAFVCIILHIYSSFDFIHGNTVKKVKYGKFETEKEIDNSKKMRKTKKTY